MTEYLKLKKSNCKNCYKCIRHCPVKSIRFSDNQAHIVEDECILCGQCFIACSQNAKEIRNDTAKAKALIAGGDMVYASIAPSFVANYNNVTIKSIETALLKLGFSVVEETAIGATIVKNYYDEIIDTGKQDIIISSCCHSVNLLIQKHFPEVLPYLAQVISPMQAHCTAIKKANPTAKTVFIGPCISKKDEAEKYSSTVDCVLTFEELSMWLASEGIVIESDIDTSDKGRARLFPISGGILRSMSRNSTEYSYLTVDGLDNCINIIKDIANGDIQKCFIEMSACVGSCIGGPAMDKNHRTPVRDYISVSKYAKWTDFDVVMPSEAELIKQFPFLGTHNIKPSTAAIEDVLRKIGKHTQEQELNCGSCGYNTCREKAIAVLQGKADLNMCLPFLKEKAENFSDNIINNTPNGIFVLNESMEIQQINKAACTLLNISNASAVLNDQVVRILDPQIYMQVLETQTNIHDKRTYLAEYNKYVEQTILYDKSYHIIVTIMRDVTDEEIERSKKENISRQTVEITDKVIHKQMCVVQEIASLLGETAAETKIALTKLKESLNNE